MKEDPMASPLVRILFAVPKGKPGWWEWLVQTIARSHFTHVAVTSMQGDTEVVMNPTIPKGTEFWRFDLWLDHPKPFGFVGWFNVPAARWPDLNDHIDPISRRLWRYAARWLTFGLLPCEDCVTKVRRVLHDAGVVTPASIVTPGQLWDHLRSEGYEYVEHPDGVEAHPGHGPSDDPPAPPRRSSARHAHRHRAA
jgi:hypothetical protein